MASVSSMVCSLAESTLENQVILGFLSRQFGLPPTGGIHVEPLHGGLEACGIAKVTAGDVQFVVKKATGDARREVEVYRRMAATPACVALPRFLGAESTTEDETYLFVEWIPRDCVWPWRNTGYSAAVLESLALIHQQKVRLPAWNYGAELAGSAETTLELLGDIVYSGKQPAGRPILKTVERAVETLPLMRQALKTAHEPAVLHGDAHASNAVVHGGDQPRVVLLDWGRARIGSPLEDVCSWLQSLGFWEWEVRRRHDSLLKCYLRARNWDDTITAELRALYWFAAASNALAGALRYHLAVANDPLRSEHERYQSAMAAQDWLRMIRRADLAWRN